jgi:hypothetical protein
LLDIPYGDCYPTTDNRRKISFLKEQVNQDNKPEVNKTFQVQIDAIRSAADYIEKVEFIIKEKKALLKNCNDVYESDRLLFAYLFAMLHYPLMMLSMLPSGSLNQATFMLPAT